jgi:hypothetical protein
MLRIPASQFNRKDSSSIFLPGASSPAKCAAFVPKCIRHLQAFLNRLNATRFFVGAGPDLAIHVSLAQAIVKTGLPGCRVGGLKAGCDEFEAQGKLILVL